MAPWNSFRPEPMVEKRRLETAKSFKTFGRCTVWRRLEVTKKAQGIKQRQWRKCLLARGIQTSANELGKAARGSASTGTARLHSRAGGSPLKSTRNKPRSSRAAFQSAKALSKRPEVGFADALSSGSWMGYGEQPQQVMGGAFRRAPLVSALQRALDVLVGWHRGFTKRFTAHRPNALVSLLSTGVPNMIEGFQMRRRLQVSKATDGLKREKMMRRWNAAKPSGGRHGHVNVDRSCEWIHGRVTSSTRKRVLSKMLPRCEVFPRSGVIWVLGRASRKSEAGALDSSMDVDAVDNHGQGNGRIASGSPFPFLPFWNGHVQPAASFHDAMPVTPVANEASLECDAPMPNASIWNGHVFPLASVQAAAPVTFGAVDSTQPSTSTAHLASACTSAVDVAPVAALAEQPRNSTLLSRLLAASAEEEDEWEEVPLARRRGRVVVREEGEERPRGRRSGRDRSRKGKEPVDGPRGRGRQRSP
ncbi:hypothetical protein HDU67_009697 [Dinochytrium kinnereticum]|nr:hypothetical protein HDU67_009697 [Dinochytrium kinnereticum]